MAGKERNLKRKHPKVDKLLLRGFLHEIGGYPTMAGYLACLFISIYAFTFEQTWMLLIVWLYIGIFEILQLPKKWAAYLRRSKQKVPPEFGVLVATSREIRAGRKCHWLIRQIHKALEDCIIEGPEFYRAGDVHYWKATQVSCAAFIDEEDGIAYAQDEVDLTAHACDGTFLGYDVVLGEHLLRPHGMRVWVRRYQGEWWFYSRYPGALETYDEELAGVPENHTSQARTSNQHQSVG